MNTLFAGMLALHKTESKAQGSSLQARSRCHLTSSRTCKLTASCTSAVCTNASACKCRRAASDSYTCDMPSRTTKQCSVHSLVRKKLMCCFQGHLCPGAGEAIKQHASLASSLASRQPLIEHLQHQAVRQQLAGIHNAAHL